MSDYDSYEAPAPAPGAVDRIMAAIDRSEVEGDARAPSRAWRWPVAAVCAAAAAFALAWVVRGGGDPVGGARIQQDDGIAMYDVVPGTPLEVVTPAGTVRALGTRFRVEVRMKRSTRVGAVVAAAAAVVVVAVYEGKVLLGNDKGETVVHAGEVGRATSDEAPRLETTATAADTPAVKKPATPGPRRFANPDERVALTRAIAAARARRDAVAPATATIETVKGSGEHAARPLGDLDKDYIRGRIQEVIPLVKECYELALVDTPDLRGKMVTEFVISGEPEIGGLVEEAHFIGDESTFDHPGMNECVSATLESIEFEPPPDGGKVVVRYPFLFSTDGPPEDE